MRHETAMEAKLKKAGLKSTSRLRLEAALNVCLANSRGNPSFAAQQWTKTVFKQGLLDEWALYTFEQWKARQNDGEVGHVAGAGNGQVSRAASPSPNDDGEGHTRCAPSGGHSEAAPPSSTEREGEGQIDDAAPSGQLAVAPPSQPKGDDEGHLARAGNGRKSAAPSSPPDRGVGAKVEMSEDQSALAPAREPTASQIKSAGDIKRKLYGSLWEKFESRYQIDLRKVRFSECFAYRDSGFRAGHFFDAVISNHPFANPDTFLTDLLSDAELAEYMAKSEEKTHGRNAA